MENHLWELNDSLVEETGNDSYYDNWDDFIKSEIWKSNYFYGCLPVYWIWVDKESEIFDYDEIKDQLTLVYLSLAPCDARPIFINIKRENEKDVEVWLKEHKFLV